MAEKNRNRKNKRRKVEEDDNGKVRGKYARLFLSGGDSRAQECRDDFVHPGIFFAYANWNFQISLCK